MTTDGTPTTSLAGRVAWITGAGSGIGEAAALTLAAAGAAVVLTGRRREPLDAVAARISAGGGTALPMPGDLAAGATAGRIVGEIERRFGRLDLLVNNAGLNIAARGWRQLTPEGIDTVLRGNLSAAFYCAAAALGPMRRAKDGVLIHTASWAGKYISPLSGPAYTAAKHAVVALSQSINIEEFRNGIRSTAILPAEVATPILDTRPVPPSAEARADMLQPEDLGALILFVATRPASVRGRDQPDGEPDVWDVRDGSSPRRAWCIMVSTTPSRFWRISWFQNRRVRHPEAASLASLSASRDRCFSNPCCSPSTSTAIFAGRQAKSRM